MRILGLVGIAAISLATYEVYGFSWTGVLVSAAMISFCVLADHVLEAQE